MIGPSAGCFRIGIGSVLKHLLQPVADGLRRGRDSPGFPGRFFSCFE